MLEFAENSGSNEEHDVDAIIAQAYGHSQNPSNESSAKEAPQQAAPEPPQYKEYEFNARGQAVKIKENDPRFQQWLSQGYDYAQNINAFKTDRERQIQEFEQQKQQFEKQFTPYREIDEFAKQNPDWWSHVDQSYKQRLSSQEPVPHSVKSYIEQSLNPLKDDIPLMKQFLQEMQTQKLEKQRSEEDTRLSDAVKTIQGKYPDLDFAAKDETGLSLEHRVLNHAVQNSFPTFRAAFLDYYHDNLEKLAESRGREAISKEMSQRKKMGLLDENPAPGSNRSSVQTVGNGAKPRSWHDPSLSSEAILREFKF
jgi:hypothetical protein